MKRILSGLAVVAALSILVSLGIWQLQRKAWKEALIADIDDRAHAPPVAFPDVWNPDIDEFRHVFATGSYLNDREILVYGLFDGGNSQTLQGGYLFTPFRLTDGGIVMVNRGFVPKGEANITRIEGPARVEGILRAPERRGWFVPENVPAKSEWFTRDSDAMAATLQLTGVLPFYVEADINPAAGTWPKGGVTRTITLRNDHLQYALTWFGLALVLICATAYALMRPQLPKQTVQHVRNDNGKR